MNKSAYSENQQRILEFGVTNKCNLYCPSCKRTGEDYDKFSDLSYDDFEELLFLNSKEFKDKRIQFCGDLGDPLMHPEIEKFINISNKFFDNIVINTNGSLRNSKWFKRVFSNNQKLYFYFGLDGIDHQTTIKYRVNSNFNKVMTHMKVCSEIDSSRVQWDFTLFDFNRHQKNQAILMAKDLGININVRENTTDWEFETGFDEKAIAYAEKDYNYSKITKEKIKPKNIFCKYYDYTSKEFISLQIDTKFKIFPCCLMVIDSYEISDFRMPFENDLHKISYDVAIKKMNTYFNEKKWKETGAHETCIKLCSERG